MTLTLTLTLTLPLLPPDPVEGLPRRTQDLESPRPLQWKRGSGSRSSDGSEEAWSKMVSPP
jgi:hypothetical protein